jgi:hypothetical protein
MLLQVMSTQSFFQFTDVLVRGGLDNAQLQPSCILPNASMNN